MVRTLNALSALRPFTVAARRAAAMLTRAGGKTPATETMFEALEERTLLAADVTATFNAAVQTGLASAGGALSGSLVLNNTGNAAATGFTYRVFLSADSIIGNEDDIELTDEDGNQATLAAGASSTVNLNTFTVPTDVRPGAYFLIAQLDTTNVVTEGEPGEANNTVQTTAPVVVRNGAATGTPNLTATLSFPARTINPDQHITVPTTIRNTTGTASGMFHVTWVLSANNIIGDADDIAIDEEEYESLAANSQFTVDRDIQLPVGIDLGSYRVGVWVDDRGDVGESNENDNRAITGSAALTVDLPDLSATFTYTGGTFSPGGFINGTLTVRNNTDALATPFTVTISLSTNATGGDEDDVLLLTVDLTDLTLEDTGLEGGDTRTISNLRVYIPYGSSAGGPLNPGAYRVVVVVDPADGEAVNGEVEETNENNNTTVSGSANVTIAARNVENDPEGADLFVYAYPISGTFTPGQTINVAAILANLGNAAATGGVAVSAFLSTDATLDEGDILMDDDVFDGEIDTLAVGSRYGNVSLVIPGAAANGNFFVIFRADPSGEVTETNEENNNASAGTAAVTRPTISITAPDASAGETSGTANGGQFRISRTGSTAADMVVHYSITGTAGEGDYNGETFTGTVTIPAGQSFVLLNLSVVNDAEAEADETVIVTIDEDDNYNVSETQNDATVTIADNEPRVTITTPDANAAESSGTANPGQFRVTRTGSTAEALVVEFDVGGTAGILDYTLSAPEGITFTFDDETGTGTITIPAGQTSAVFNVTVTQDATSEEPETVVVSLQSTDDYSVNPDSFRGTVTIADDEPIVTVAATDNAAAESAGTANGGRFTFTRPGPATGLGALTIYFTLSGTANEGEGVDGDFTLSSSVAGSNLSFDEETETWSITIPAGALTVTLDVTVDNDAISEEPETAIVTLAEHTSYRLSANEAQRTGTVTIADNEPVVTVAATDNAAAESAGTANGGRFTFTRPGPATGLGALTLHFTLTGTATEGEDGDYALSSSVAGSNLSFDEETEIWSITIPAGTLTVTLDVTVDNDALAEDAETAIVTLVADPAYRLSNNAAQRTGTVTIADNEPIVSVAASDNAAAETTGTANGGRFTFTRPSPATGQPALTIFFTLTGTADEGATEDDDFALSSSVAGSNLSFDEETEQWSITIPAGAASVTLDVTVDDDAIAEAAETAIVTLVASDTYRLSPNEGQRTGTVTIADNEPIVTITGVDTQAAETFGVQPANGAQFRVSRPSTNTAGAMVVHFTVTGTTDSAADYTISAPVGVTVTFDDETGEGTVTIPAGQASVLFNLVVTNDAAVEAAETAVVTLVATDAYRVSTIASQRIVTATIADNEPVVSIRATDNAAAEVFVGGTQNLGNFRISRTGDLTEQLTVNVIVSGTADNQDWIDFVTTELVIPAGQAFYDNPVIPIDDSVWENAETIVITLQTGDGYTLTSSVAQRTATVNITDNENTISVRAQDRNAAEVGGGGTANGGLYRFSRTGGSNAGPVTIFFQMSGTADMETDYALTSSVDGANVEFDAETGEGSITIPAGASFVTLNLQVANDATAESAETAIITLVEDESYRLATSASQRTGTVTIADNESTVAVAASDNAAAEVTTGTANGGRFTFSRTLGSNTAALTVFFTISGTASDTLDFALSSTVAGADVDYDAETNIGSITIPAGAASVTLDVAVTDDLLVESAETVILTLNENSTYRLSPNESQRAGTVSIADNEPTFAVTANDASGAETTSTTPNRVGFRISRTGGGNGQTSVVNFSLTGTATAGVDYAVSITPVAGATLEFDNETGIGTVTFTGNVTQVSLLVTPALDNTAEGTETVICQLLDPTEGDQQYRVSTTQHTANGSIANATFADLTAVGVGAFDDVSFSRTGVGQQVSFELNVQNTGTTTLTSVRATLFLQSAGGARTSIGTGVFEVNLAPNGSTTLEITFTLSGFPAVGTYTPGATVAIVAGGTDAISANNSVLGEAGSITVTA